MQEHEKTARIRQAIRTFQYGLCVLTCGADEQARAASVTWVTQVSMRPRRVAVAIRRECPRLPVVFYSIQDDDDYYRAFRESGILSHYAYVRKSNYLLPAMILPLLLDAVAGRSLIDPDIEVRVQEVRLKDSHAPLDLLEPAEQAVATMLAQGMTNEQIAAQMGFRDKRTVSRINGQIYAAWGLNTTTTDEKVARTRAAIIYNEGRLIMWDDLGRPQVLNQHGEWVDRS